MDSGVLYTILQSKKDQVVGAPAFVDVSCAANALLSNSRNEAKDIQVRRHNLSEMVTKEEKVDLNDDRLLNQTQKLSYETDSDQDDEPVEPSAKKSKKFKCTQCSYEGGNLDLLVRHERQAHKGENPFQCDRCDYSCYNKTLYEEHVRRHLGVKPYKCSVCNYCSASKNNTRKHEKLHSEDNPNRCTICGFVSRSSKVVKTHMGYHGHSGAFLKCDCGYTSESLHDFMEHRTNSHTNLCSVCKVKFNSKARLKEHVCGKAKKNWFKCKHCKWKSVHMPKVLLHLIHHPNQDVDEDMIDLTILKKHGIM